jgi:hypothetical protein
MSTVSDYKQTQRGEKERSKQKENAGGCNLVNLSKLSISNGELLVKYNATGMEVQYQR